VNKKSELYELMMGCLYFFPLLEESPFTQQHQILWRIIRWKHEASHVVLDRYRVVRDRRTDRQNYHNS